MEIKLYSKKYASELLEIYSFYVHHSVFTFDIVPPNLQDFHEKLAASHACLVGVEGDKAIGFVYASAHRVKAAYDTVCETTIYMASDHRGAGHGTMLYARLLQLLQVLGYYTALGGITVPNEGSEALHRKLGFIRSIQYENIGYKAGAWRNVDWWRKDLLPFDAAPAPPKDLQEISGSELADILTLT